MMPDAKQPTEVYIRLPPQSEVSTGFLTKVELIIADKFRR